jgi:predicted  nucleic acid-binding Zn-ribbon protein
MPRFNQYLARVGGARPDVAAQVPNALQLHATMGVTLLALGFLAGMSWGYAAYRLFLGEPAAMLVAIVVGSLGALLMFTIDRSMTLSLNKRAPFKRLILPVVGRALLGFVLAWTISMPSILRFSRTVLATHLFAVHNQMTDAQFTLNASRLGVAGQIQSAKQLEEQLQLEEARLKQPPDTDTYRRLVSELTSARRSRDNVVSGNARQIESARQAIEDLRALPARSDRSEQIATLEGRIDRWQSQNRAAETRLVRAQQAEQNEYAAWTNEVKQRVATLAAALDEAKKRVQDTEGAVADRNVGSEAQIRALLTPNLAREYTAYRQIVGDKSNPDSWTLAIWGYAFHLFYFLLEITPLILKLSGRPGPVDDGADAGNATDTNRLNLQADTEMLLAQTREEAWRELVTKSINDCKTKHLQQSPIDLKSARQELEVLAA